jgi:hypothetical protein
MVNINEFIVKPVPKKMEDVILIVKNFNFYLAQKRKKKKKLSIVLKHYMF